MLARNLVLALAGAVALSTPALASDFGISFHYSRGYYDDYYYDPPVVVYDSPPVYYAPPPVVYYRSAPPVAYHRYYAPAYRTVRRYSYTPAYRSYGPHGRFGAGFYYRGHHHYRHR
jgi:hypothetical protein